MRKKIVVISLLVAVVVVVTLCVIGRNMFYGSAVDREYEVVLEADDSYSEMIAKVKVGMDNHLAFDYYADHIDLKRTIKPGRYTIKKGMTVMEIARMLKIGVRNTSRLVINNVRTPEALAEKIASQTNIKAEDMVAILRDEAFVKSCGFDSPEAMFSIFLPNTYEVKETITPRELVEYFINECDKFWSKAANSESLATLAASTSIKSSYDVMVLASIVYEETKCEEEMARVAGVYINRLNKGMLLQADPTVKYALGDPTIKRILYEHLEVDSPYNTYKYKGLPPTPITMPDMAAIAAVLNYEKHDYLYFCATPELDGRHNFAKTHTEHQRNARAYHNAIKGLK